MDESPEVITLTNPVEGVVWVEHQHPLEYGAFNHERNPPVVTKTRNPPQGNSNVPV